MEKYGQQFKKRLTDIKIGLTPISLKKWRASSLILFFGIICFFSLMFSAMFSQYQITRTFSEEWTIADKYDLDISDEDWILLKKDMRLKQESRGTANISEILYAKLYFHLKKPKTCTLRIWLFC